MLVRCLACLCVLMLLQSLSTPLLAQMKNYTIIVYKEEEGKKKPTPLGDAFVYGFYSEKQAKAFVEKSKDQSYTFPPSDFYDGVTEAPVTDPDGVVELTLPPTGCVVVRAPGCEIKGGRPYVKVGKDFEVKIYVSATRTMGEVEKVASGKLRNEPGVSISVGKDKFVSQRVWLFEEQTGDNARMVLTPVVVELETGDTMELRKPIVKDGEKYSQTQRRRMGGNLRNDRLEPYRIKSYLANRGLDSVQIDFVIHKRKKENHYKVVGWQRYADFQHIYYRDDSLIIDEGFDKEPMRFLDYNLMGDTLDTKRYVRTARREPQNDQMKLFLNFAQGASELSPTDTASLRQLAMVQKRLQAFERDPNSAVLSANISGKASPEGGFEINNRLSKERMQYILSQIKKSPALRGVDIVPEASVATWDDVANELERDSLKDYAARVRAITSMLKDMRKQEEQIRQLPFYAYIADTVLPRLRAVDFKYTFITQRPKTPKEVYALYQTDPVYRSGTGLMAYEFGYLFNMVKDKHDLEVLAKAAMETVNDTKPTRSWPWAAYVLAHCYLDRDTVDVHLLEPYLNWKRIPDCLAQVSAEGSARCWENDRAIVSTQIMMLCQDGDYMQASKVSANLLPNEPKYREMVYFLKCLAGNWHEDSVRSVVAASSVWNKAIVYAAQDPRTPGYKDYHKQALELLLNDPEIDQNAPRTLYTIAQLRFREVKDLMSRRDTIPERHFIKAFIDDGPITATGYGADLEQEAPEDWGYPMVQCCLKDESFRELLKYDGEFSKGYRIGFDIRFEKLKKSLAAARQREAEEALLPDEEDEDDEEE